MSPDHPPMRIAEDPEGRLAVATVTGDLNVGSAPAVYQLALEAIHRWPHVIIDLSGVTFCDSSGFNALLRLRRRAQESGNRLSLAAPPTQVARLLTLTGAGTVFPVYGTPAEARAERHDQDGGA
ncbi:STAS domain-containing protein [Streptomyces sp. NPDC096013]|uniref:STAS domain-containing protein n=1 Tax=Streptomyces sp. NPDC096013 TaxID=3366069 RepID=UPI0038210727